MKLVMTMNNKKDKVLVSAPKKYIKKVQDNPEYEVASNCLFIAWGRLSGVVAESNKAAPARLSLIKYKKEQREKGNHVDAELYYYDHEDGWVNFNKEYRWNNMDLCFINTKDPELTIH